MLIIKYLNEYPVQNMFFAKEHSHKPALKKIVKEVEKNLICLDSTKSIYLGYINIELEQIKAFIYKLDKGADANKLAYAKVINDFTEIFKHPVVILKNENNILINALTHTEKVYIDTTDIELNKNKKQPYIESKYISDYDFNQNLRSQYFSNCGIEMDKEIYDYLFWNYANPDFEKTNDLKITEYLKNIIVNSSELSCLNKILLNDRDIITKNLSVNKEIVKIHTSKFYEVIKIIKNK